MAECKYRAEWRSSVEGSGGGAPVRWSACTFHVNFMAFLLLVAGLIDHAEGAGNWKRSTAVVTVIARLRAGDSIVRYLLLV